MMLCTECLFPDVSEDHSASDTLYHCNDTASLPRKLESAVSQLWEPAIWQRMCVVTKDPDFYSIRSKESHINSITDHYGEYQFCFIFMCFWDQISGDWLS